MHLLAEFVGDEQSLEIVRDALFLGCAALILLVVLANVGPGLTAIWSSVDSNAVLANTLG